MVKLHICEESRTIAYTNRFIGFILLKTNNKTPNKGIRDTGFLLHIGTLSGQTPTECLKIEINRTNICIEQIAFFTGLSPNHCLSLLVEFTSIQEKCPHLKIAYPNTVYNFFRITFNQKHGFLEY